MPLNIGAPNAQDRTFSDQAWGEVLEAVDKAYAELVTYQERLERQNFCPRWFHLLEVS